MNLPFDLYIIVAGLSGGVVAWLLCRDTDNDGITLLLVPLLAAAVWWIAIPVLIAMWIGNRRDRARTRLPRTLPPDLDEQYAALCGHPRQARAGESGAPS